jgi:hypothetical protein
MGDEGHDDEEDDEEDDDSDDEENPFGKKDDDSEDDEEDDSDDESEDENEYEEMGLREYRETVGNDWNTGKQKEQGRNIGSNSGETYPAPSEGKPIIRAETSKGKPTTGATAENIAQGGTGVGEMSGTSPNADKGSRGLVGSTKGEFTKGVEKNISSSSKASMTAGSKLEKNTAGHGAERKGGAAGPVGSGNGKLAGQTSNGAVKSPLTGAPNRNA